MGTNSKKQKRQVERKAKRLQWELARVERSTQLPSEVAESSQLPEFLDGLNYQLIFESYKHNLCELHLLDQTSSKALIKKLSLITRYNSKSIAGSGLVKDKIENAGNYSPLYSGLPADIELKEVPYSGTGRIFCYFVNEYPQSEKFCNYCCIVAIKRQHTRT